MAGAVILVSALAGRAEADHVEPEFVEGNQTCGSLAPEGVTWIELKVEPVMDGTDSDGVLTVTIDVRDTEDGPVFDWTSNIGVDAVFVKGGPDGNLYQYDPPTESTEDTGLHAPVNPANDMFFGLSHVSFCYDVEDEETTTTTEKDTTTTTEEETTTTTEKGATTTAPEEETTTTAAPMEELPRTGSSSGPMVGLGAGLLAIGAGLVGATRLLRRPA